MCCCEDPYLKYVREHYGLSRCDVKGLNTAQEIYAEYIRRFNLGLMS